MLRRRNRFINFLTVIVVIIIVIAACALCQGASPSSSSAKSPVQVTFINRSSVFSIKNIKLTCTSTGEQTSIGNLDPGEEMTRSLPAGTYQCEWGYYAKESVGSGSNAATYTCAQYNLDGGTRSLESGRTYQYEWSSGTCSALMYFEPELSVSEE